MKWLKAHVHADSRTLLLRLLSRLHCALLMAPLCVLAFDFLRTTTLTDLSEGPLLTLTDSQLVILYLRALLFAVPVVLSWYAARDLKYLWQYLLASLLISALTWLLMGHPGGAVLGVLVCFFRGRARLSETQERSILDSPHYLALLVFLLPFLLSAVNGLPVTQRLSLISAALYLLVCFAFRGVSRIDAYLELNRNMHGLPVRRIQRIGGAAVLAVALLGAVLLLPAVFGMQGDFRIDIDHTQPTGQIHLDDYEPPEAAMNPDDMMMPILDDVNPPFELPPFVRYLLFSLVVAGIAALALYSVYQIFKNFRFSYTDSRDEVHFLSDLDRKESTVEPGEKKKRIPFLDRSPNARIRRLYRRTVLRASKDEPKGWQAPGELENQAGLTIPQLHGLYEKARYGKAPCTAEELRALKEKT